MGALRRVYPGRLLPSRTKTRVLLGFAGRMARVPRQMRISGPFKSNVICWAGGAAIGRLGMLRP
jgi:hypothetical protein